MAMHNIFQKKWVHLFWLRIAFRHTRHKPGQANQSGAWMFQSLSYLLLVHRVKCFPCSFYANLPGRHNIISRYWTVRKEVGSSDTLLGCKNRLRRNRFFGLVRALMLVCHYTSSMDQGSKMTMFRHQSLPYCWVNTGATENTAKTATLISHWAGRILTQCNSLDGKRIRTRGKSIVSISHSYTSCSRGREGI